MLNKIKALLLIAALGASLAACSTGDGGGGDAGSSTAGYTVEVSELDPSAYPADYPLIPSADFATAFENLKDANMDGSLSSYQDVADIFGVDGAYYVNNDFEADDIVYKYYAWYADAGESLLITFEADGNDLNYFAYAGNGIS